jgi:hypothetical protein
MGLSARTFDGRRYRGVRAAPLSGGSGTTLRRHHGTKIRTKSDARVGRALDGGAETLGSPNSAEIRLLRRFQRPKQRPNPLFGDLDFGA